MPSLIQLITALALLTQAQAATPAADDAAACERAAGAEAVAACDRLISSASEQGSALARLYRNRCAAHIAARNADGALTDCNEAVRLDPAAAASYMARGDAFRSKRELARALADYGEAIRLDPQHADAYVRRGRALRARGEYEGAIADFGQALRLDPSNAVAFLDRGLAWLDQHDYDRAIADFNEAARLDPDNPAALTNRGLALERKGETAPARASFQAAVAAAQKRGSSKWARETARERLAALTPAQPMPPVAATPAAPAAPVAPAPAPPLAAPVPGAGPGVPPAGAPRATDLPRARSQLPAERAGPRVALLIGISSYPEADAPLIAPKNDALVLANELKRIGFEVELAEDLPKGGFHWAIENFKKTIKPGSTALFFFSGYGLQANRQTYLIPADAEIWREADVAREGTNLETVLADMNSQGAAVKLAIIDASRRNPYERRFRSVAAGLAPINVAKDSLVIYSAGPGEALTETAGEQSLFMSELLKELRSPGISAEEVFTRTRIGVSRASETEQVPWVASSLLDLVYFVHATADRRGRQ
jgi:Tfp pilus assembly protein PilF